MSANAVMQVPESDVDLWTDEALLAPYELWQELRERGPVVRLSKHDLWALPRYEETRKAVDDPQLFSSAFGVSVNPAMNDLMRGTTICSDPPRHRELRSVLRRPLRSEPLPALRVEIESEANDLVERLLAERSFDAAAELAHHLPLTIVARQVGLPDQGRHNMLKWSAAGFNCNGPVNERVNSALPIVEEALAYMSDPDLPARLTPGGWAAALWEAAEGDELTDSEARSMLADYWAPSLDTTIFGITNAILLFGEHPEQWDALCSDPSLIPHSVNEVLRLESPLPYFTRVATREHQFDACRIPRGARVLLMYGSANRDERKWTEADRFDVRRKPSDHLAFGHGEHHCVGHGLARMEIAAVLQALIRRVRTFELGQRERVVNNWARGMARLDVTVHPA